MRVERHLIRIAVGSLARRLGSRWRKTLLVLEQRGKITLGLIAGLTGVLILTGADKPLESSLVGISPGWLTHLTTQF